ncbi:MAG: hypothetical protein ACJ75R_06185 [Solirubrobacterales bacterium]
MRLRRLAIVSMAISLLAVGTAAADRLDHRTALTAANQVAKKDCHATTGCVDYYVVRLHRISRYVQAGKIATVSVNNGERFICTRRIVIKLHHMTGKITYAVSKRKCRDVGPA